MNLRSVFIHALQYGVILSAVLFPLILVLLRIKPEIMLNDYPPDIRAKHGPMSERSRRQRLPVGLFFVAVVIGIVALSFSRVHVLAGGDISFLFAFVHAFTMFSVVNLLDLLVLDWPMVAIRPRFIVLSGTEGLAGYRDYWFHFRGFLIGEGITVVASIVTAAVVAALF